MYLSIDRSIDRSAEILHSICRRYLPSISPTRAPIAPQKAMYLDPKCLHIYICIYTYTRPWPSRGRGRAVAVPWAVGRGRGRGHGRGRGPCAVAEAVAVGRSRGQKSIFRQNRRPEPRTVQQVRWRIVWPEPRWRHPKWMFLVLSLTWTIRLEAGCSWLFLLKTQASG